MPGGTSSSPGQGHPHRGAPAPRRRHRTVPEELLTLVRALVRDRRLAPVARVSTRRLEHSLLGDGRGGARPGLRRPGPHRTPARSGVPGPGLAGVGGGARRRRPGPARCRRAAPPRRRRRAALPRPRSSRVAWATRFQPRPASRPGRSCPAAAPPRSCSPTCPSTSPSCRGRTSDSGPTNPARSTSSASPPADCVPRSRPTGRCSSPARSTESARSCAGWVRR